VTREWDAGAYHRLSGPQLGWGLEVLARLPLRGDETLLDAGCGTGRLTERLLERVPRGQVLALDYSREMLAAARAHLARFADRVTFLEMDLGTLALDQVCDVVFSTATLHWVLDQARLFRALHRALRPGGRLIAQCGGGPNLAAVLLQVDTVQNEPPFAAHLAGYAHPWEYAAADTAAARLRAAGFADVETSLTAAPVAFEDEGNYREFLRTIILRLHVERLPEALRGPFVDAVVARVARPLVLDYWRLNLAGRKILTAGAS
jgi:trans-aconitate methyltransferase